QRENSQDERNDNCQLIWFMNPDFHTVLHLQRRERGPQLPTFIALHTPRQSGLLLNLKTFVSAECGSQVLSSNIIVCLRRLRPVRALAVPGCRRVGRECRVSALAAAVLPG